MRVYGVKVTPLRGKPFWGYEDGWPRERIYFSTKKRAVKSLLKQYQYDIESDELWGVKWLKSVEIVTLEIPEPEVSP